MLIFKITIYQARNVESIELNIIYNLIIYLSNGGEPSPEDIGSGSPSYFVFCYTGTIIIFPIGKGE